MDIKTEADYTKSVELQRERWESIEIKDYTSDITPAFRSGGDIVLTMTSCKRLPLFIRTVNSLLYAFSDQFGIFKKWVVIDDNSSESDRATMKELFPFIEYVFKTPAQKGHVSSMRMIQNIAAKTVPEGYVMHVEDDFLFFNRDPDILNRMKRILEEPDIGQVMFNINYTETAKDGALVVGGDYKTIEKTGEVYVVHEMCETPEERIAFNTKWKSLGEWSSNYWPHFSLRPSLIRTRVLNAYEIGRAHV